MHGNSRTYSYDDQGIGYSQSNTANGGGHTSNYSYTEHIYPEQSSGHYYSSASQSGIAAHGHSDPRYGRSTTPAPGMGSRYGRHPTDPRYYHSSGGISSSTSHGGNGPPSAPLFSTHQYPTSQSPASQRDRFIPTPSEIAHAYGNYSGSIPDQHLSQSPSTYPTPGHHSRYHHQTSTSPILSTTRATTIRSSHASATSPSNERFPCEICGKTFSRSHDRKRHHETQHIPSPVLHRCRYCRKEFSRADSLKRHLDNGCDEMPTNSNN
ncbi:hypothetical protein F5050DRAFT_1811317 [Lentinula boryana]|uniref:C2H2-type domain-containing protein n=1 Tax=Lentinula boryana TaxID=40481 RepID=A0ABQ8Q1M9_9AGAR|nr:hypothetical protein F5050DRAFT_1811317 [Lentinula boryana]